MIFWFLDVLNSRTGNGVLNLLFSIAISSGQEGGGGCTGMDVQLILSGIESGQLKHVRSTVAGVARGDDDIEAYRESQQSTERLGRILAARRSWADPTNGHGCTHVHPIIFFKKTSYSLHMHMYTLIFRSH
jgi:hypothetical protein